MSGTTDRTSQAARPRTILEAEKLGFSYEGNAVIEDATFNVLEGEFVCLLGASGCGKTTLLNLIAGFLQPTAGLLHFHGKPILGPGPERAMVFQNAALFDWMTVRDNITFSQICRDRPKAERAAISARMVKLVGLEGVEDRYPYELSGGMKQRAGVARVLAANASIMLMDEPFAAVDVQTRESLQEELLRIHQETGCTIVFVTHSIDEAVFLANRIFLMSKRGDSTFEEFQVDLPAPRWRMENRLDSQFVALRERIYRRMRGDIRQ